MNKYETVYVSVNPERGLHFTAQLKHVVIVKSDELWQENGYANTFQLLNGDINPAEPLLRRVSVAKVLNMLPPASGQK